MNLFVSELRKASRVMAAYRDGARSVPAIAARARVRVNEVAEWAVLLGLEITSPKYPFARGEGMEPPTFHQLNNQA